MKRPAIGILVVIYLAHAAWATAEHAREPGAPSVRGADPGHGLEGLVKVVGAETSEIQAIAADMKGPFCGPASVTMLMKFQGADPDFAQLRNLSWTTGFHCAVAKERIHAMWPTTPPRRQLERIAKTMGFTMKVEKHQSAEEAAQNIIRHLDKNEPVAVNWAPHLAVVYGYGYRLMAGRRELYFLVHDPRDPKSPGLDSPDFSFEKGPAHLTRYSEWAKDPLLAWGRPDSAAAGFPVYVFEKTGRPESVNLKDLLKEHAERTLGTGRGVDKVVPAGAEDSGVEESFGAKGIRNCAAAFPASFVNEPYAFTDAFYLGEAPRRDAADFWKARSEAAQNAEEKQAFATAAAAFAKSSEAFGRARAAAEEAMGEVAKSESDPPEKQAHDRKTAGQKIQALMIGIARAEEELGKVLEKASASLP